VLELLSNARVVDDTMTFVPFSLLYLVVPIMLIITPIRLRLMVEGIVIGFSDMLSIAQTFGIVGTMVLTLIFSRKQLQSLSIHDQTRVLNDLDEKVRKMAEIIIEKPSMQKVIYKLEKPSEELAFAYYILFISSHAYSMRQKNVLNDEEWTGWLNWMKNCFKYGTLGEQWEQIRLERWLNPAFENFVNSELMGARSQ